MPFLPLRMLAVQLAHFLCRRIKVALIAIRIPQIVADGRFPWSNPLGFPILHDSLRQVITVLLVLMSTLLVAVAVPFLRSLRHAPAATFPEMQEAA